MSPILEYSLNFEKLKEKYPDDNKRLFVYMLMSPIFGFVSILTSKKVQNLFEQFMNWLKKEK